MEETMMITLEDQKSYLIVDQIERQSIHYYYLCSTTKPIEIKIAVEKNDEIYFIEDPVLLSEIYDEFVTNMKEKMGISED